LELRRRLFVIGMTVTFICNCNWCDVYL